MSEPTRALDRDGASAVPRRADPFVREITVGDVNEAWVQGLRDFQAAPIFGLAFGAFYAAAGIVIVSSATVLGLSYLVYPLAAGFALRPDPAGRARLLAAPSRRAASATGRRVDPQPVQAGKGRSRTANCAGATSPLRSVRTTLGTIIAR